MDGMRTSTFAAVLLATANALAATPAPLARFETGGSGFIDDAYAVRDDGKAVAYIVTDGATSATLHLAELGGSDVTIAGAPIDATGVAWLSPTRVLVVRGHEGTSTAQAFTAAGADKAKLGPFNRWAIATVDSKRAFVTYTRTEKKGVEHALVAYSVDTLRPIKRRTWHEDAEGQIKQGASSVKPLWWSGGFTVLAALRAGEFDKARDMRRPDRYARIDTFGGKVLAESEVQDVLAFTQVSLLRRDQPNQDVIIRYSDDRKRLLVVDGIGEYEIAPARGLAMYDFSSLAWQTLDDKLAAFSLTIDPVNPEAVARKKADPDEFELYLLDRATHAPRRILQLPGQGRRASWAIAGKRLVLLRKDKGFDRGGVALEAYDLDEAARAASP